MSKGNNGSEREPLQQRKKKISNQEFCEQFDPTVEEIILTNELSLPVAEEIFDAVKNDVGDVRRILMQAIDEHLPFLSAISKQADQAKEKMKIKLKEQVKQADSIEQLERINEKGSYLLNWAIEHEANDETIDQEIEHALPSVLPLSEKDFKELSSAIDKLKETLVAKVNRDKTTQERQFNSFYKSGQAPEQKPLNNMSKALAGLIHDASTSVEKLKNINKFSDILLAYRKEGQINQVIRPNIAEIFDTDSHNIEGYLNHALEHGNFEYTEAVSDHQLSQRDSDTNARKIQQQDSPGLLRQLYTWIEDNIFRSNIANFWFRVIGITFKKGDVISNVNEDVQDSVDDLNLVETKDNSVQAVSLSQTEDNSVQAAPPSQTVAQQFEAIALKNKKEVLQNLCQRDKGDPLYQGNTSVQNMIEAINRMTIKYADDVEKLTGLLNQYEKFIDYAKEYEPYRLLVDRSTVSKKTDSNTPTLRESIDQNQLNDEALLKQKNDQNLKRLNTRDSRDLLDVKDKKGLGERLIRSVWVKIWLMISTLKRHKVRI